MSTFVPVVLGFFGLGTGYLIWGPQELLGFPRRDPSVNRSLGVWGIFLPGLCQVVTGIILFVGLTWFRVFTEPPLFMAAVAFSAYLTYLSLRVLRAACPYCLADAGIAVALLAVLLVRRPAATGKHAPTRLRRVAALGAALAVVTVVFAAGVFVADTPTAASTYQESLARHLASSGAVFYGAYW